MKRALLVLLALCATADAQQIFRSGVDGVIIPVSVRAGNKAISGLKAADFELRDNGVLQEIRDAESEKVPIDLTLLLDLSTSVDGPMLQRLKTAVVDTAGLLRGEDRIRLIAISQVLHEVFGFSSRGATVSLDGLSAQGATSLYDGLAATMMRTAEPGRRQLIVAYTDGRDSTSVMDESAVRAIAELTDAVVDIVVPIGASRGDVSRRIAQPRSGVDSLSGAPNVTVNGQGSAAGVGEGVPTALAAIVAPTAGQVFALPPDTSISKIFKTMLDDFRSTYVLQYVPQGVDARGWHDVEVSVKKRGKFDIKARKGYRGRGTIPSGEE
jgi:VWFA-related protein